ncbi:hydroxysqualene dehydroxylase HpnE [uncultured Aquitalea sp.]|uniref:hydroxysqualene dehydroxylase HpnE n=1 Tax=uncultured Aquitalea sp. TaxID=540272 RepID=UPI0025F80994|nr:hydroxysqualene dehydroxylase HpnE [uncultured Aquitalea sp.]
MSLPRVAVIGAGWAGLAAAVELSGQAELTLYEAGREPGGRARRVGSTDGKLDNGQHILIGAYAECLRLMRKVGVDADGALLRQPLNWVRAGGICLRCPDWPAPWHVLGGLLAASGISIGDKWRMLAALQSLKLRGWRLPADMPVADWLRQTRQTPRMIREFWRPLILSALNTPPEAASMRTLAAVLRDSMGGGREASDLLLPATDLSSLFPLPALARLQAQGARWRGGHRVERLQALDRGVTVDGELFDAVVVAVAPYHLSALLPMLADRVKAFSYWPIYTVYLRYDADIALPDVMIGRQGGTADWLFDRQRLTGERGLIAAVISAPDEYVAALGRDDVIAAVKRDAEAIQPDLAASRLLSSQLIVEKRATFAATVDLARPDCRAAGAGIYLAGDWTHPDYPATLEGAARSGVTAARALLTDLS